MADTPQIKFTPEEYAVLCAMSTDMISMKAHLAERYHAAFDSLERNGIIETHYKMTEKGARVFRMVTSQRRGPRW